MEDVDFSGSAVLKAVAEELRKQDVTLVMSYVAEPVMAELQRDGLLDLIGKEHVFTGAQDMLAAYKALPPRTTAE